MSAVGRSPSLRQSKPALAGRILVKMRISSLISFPMPYLQKLAKHVDA
jgi:hypothetical protein